VGIHASKLLCKERERLTQGYLDATENSRKVSNSVEDIHSAEWWDAIKEVRKASDTALAVLKTHIQEHGC
jgi:hypothetical protein